MCIRDSAKSVSPLLVPLSESSQMELSEFLNHHIEAGLYFRLSGQYQEDIYHEEDNDVVVRINSELYLKHKENTSHYSISNVFKNSFIPFLESIGLDGFVDSLESYLSGDEKLVFGYGVPKGVSNTLKMFEVQPIASTWTKGEEEEKNEIFSPLIKLISSGGSDIPDYSYFMSLLRAFGGPGAKDRYLYGFDIPGEGNKNVLIVKELVESVADVNMFFHPKTNDVEEELSGVKNLLSMFSGAKSFKEEDERFLYAGLSLLAFYLQMSGEVLKDMVYVSDTEVSPYHKKKFRNFDFRFYLPAISILPSVIVSRFEYYRKTGLDGYERFSSHEEEGNGRGGDSSDFSASLKEKVSFKCKYVFYSKGSNLRIVVDDSERRPTAGISYMLLRPNKESNTFDLELKKTKPLFPFPGSGGLDFYELRKEESENMDLLLGGLYTLLQKVSFGAGEPDKEEISFTDYLWQKSLEKTFGGGGAQLEEKKLHLCLPLLGTSRGISLIDVLLGKRGASENTWDLSLGAREEAISSLSKFLSSIMKEAEEVLGTDKKQGKGKRGKSTKSRRKKTKAGVSDLEAVYFYLLQEGISKALKLLYLTSPKEGKLFGEVLSLRDDKPKEISVDPAFNLYLYPLEITGRMFGKAPSVYLDVSSSSKSEDCRVVFSVENKMAYNFRITPISISVERSLKLYL